MTKSTLNSALNFLKQTRIFKDADEKILTSVLNTYGKSVSYAKNDIVFSRETYSPVLCLIIKGEARVSKGETVISHLKDGEIFGAAFLYNQSYEFENTVTALTPLKVVIIEKNGVDELIKCDSSVSFNYISYLSERIGFLNSKIEGYTKPNAEEKLMLYLKKNADINNGKCEISVSMTELSHVLQISRASLYRVIETLENQGKICRDGKKIYVK
ncbi:MAG: Crp/Fnr family transcriptional regulator [Clostridia bacterium]|nr:Crp/Fnr family transcriptional regulator [Oscillospiraceae bacterium]MBQ3524335.1 Crp/Fnr family transcriptional regulator [Clostridia bacterium]